jgi:CheY-like chemotaxis protein
MICSSAETAPAVDRILVDDDLPDNYFLLQTVLESEGYLVEVADSGRVALESIASNPPDLVLLDVMMPEMSGFEVTRRLRQNPALPFIPILLVTGYSEKARSIKITEPYLDELTGKQVTRTHRLTDTELGLEGVAAFNRAEKAIASADWSKLPISPIDYIKQKIEDAGHSIGEITGRTHVLKYGSATELASGIVTYQTRERGTAQKKQVMDDFQNGRMDAVITNSTTGYSLHASRTVADQRQRVMYIVQPHLDVNQVEQSIGRSHRSGQVNPAIHPPDKLDEKGQPM